MWNVGSAKYLTFRRKKSGTARQLYSARMGRYPEETDLQERKCEILMAKNSYLLYCNGQFLPVLSHVPIVLLCCWSNASNGCWSLNIYLNILVLFCPVAHLSQICWSTLGLVVAIYNIYTGFVLFYLLHISDLLWGWLLPSNCWLCSKREAPDGSNRCICTVIPLWCTDPPDAAAL